MKEIELQNGMKAIVDDEDFERVNQFNWTVCTDSNKTTFRVVSRRYKKVQSLSHFLLNREDVNEKVIIFKNGNTLDFRKNNLLLVSRSVECYRRKGARNTSSKYKGVSFDKKNKKWTSQIRVNGKLIHLGRFGNEDEAAAAYNRAAIEHFGEEAYQNIIGKDNSASITSVDKVSLPRKRKVDTASKYRGVHSHNQGWVARIKGEYLGIFQSEIEAAATYNKAAIEAFGDKAILNDLEGME